VSGKTAALTIINSGVSWQFSPQTVNIGCGTKITVTNRSNADHTWTGSSWAFALATLIIIIWAATGPIFHYSDTWQLVINTGTTIVTFLMVFLIQSTQSRDTRALHLKIDELIRVTGPARNRLILAEEAGRTDLDAMRSELQDAARQE